MCVCIYITPSYTYLLPMLGGGRKKGTVTPKDTLGSRGEREGLSPLLCAMVDK